MATGNMDALSVQLAYAKRNNLFARMQHIFELSKTISLESSREAFISSAATLTELRSEFRTVLDEHNLLLLKTDPKATPQYDALDAFEDMFCSCKHLLGKLGNNVASSNVPRVPDRPSLPPINIVSFDGEIRNWPLFYASFKSIVHDNDHLTKDEKLYYLLGKLSSNAQRVIAGITLSGEHYDDILKTLIENFEDKRLLADTYLEQILNFKFSGPPSSSNFTLFTDKVTTAVNGLKNLKLDDLADFILLHLSMKKLHLDTARGFEAFISDSKIPTFEQLASYIKSQNRVYRNTTNLVTNSKVAETNDKAALPKTKYSVPSVQTYVVEAPEREHKCLCDNIVHDQLFKCPEFQNMIPKSRYDAVKSRRACIICLSVRHNTGKCRSKSRCLSCKKRHHSLLHFEATSSEKQQPSCSVDLKLPRQAQSINCSVSAQVYASNKADKNFNVASNTTIALATAQVIIYDTENCRRAVRCLLDSASQSNFITTDCCHRLGLIKDRDTDIIVTGIGGLQKRANGEVDVRFCSKFNESYSYNISALIVDRITSDLPSAPIDISALPHLKALSLADNTFDTPGSIDMLIGAAVFPHLLLPSKVDINIANVPPVIDTVLGYVVAGSLPTGKELTTTDSSVQSCCAVIDDLPVDALLTRFWEIEEVNVPRPQDPKDVECEEHFKATTTRDASGRYKVALPFCEDPYLLGESYSIARRRYMYLERKKIASPPFGEAYNKVIRSYIDDGFLSAVKMEETGPSYIIPHHGVYRPEKSTPLRPVLDARPLNKFLHTGPNLQGDLFSIILNFRLFPIAFCADIRKMFLQIKMHERDRRFQRILYRFNPQEPIQMYEFSRVCFGLKSSPFHALRVVRQLVLDEGGELPVAAAIASTALYMDDVVYSVPTEEAAITAVDQLITLFKKGQLDLVKWNSNSLNVLQHVPPSHRSEGVIEFDKQFQHKILGLHWSTVSDNFEFKIATPVEKCTKRTILSTVARLWDVMGFAAPTILYAKLLIRELWLLKCDWDDAPPAHIIDNWKKICEELPYMNGLKIPRHIGVYTGAVINIMGFADASERAYGAVVYLHIAYEETIRVELVCAKSRLAPTKTLTIARLELCALELLTRLLRRVCETYASRCIISNIFAFTDSKVVLYWVNSQPHRWSTFVANRVVKIVDCFPIGTFFHVPGTENPADCLSRGLLPRKLLSHPLWFHGPPWASLSPCKWPISRLGDLEVNEDTIPDQKLQSYPTTTVEDPVIYALAKRLSSWTKILNVIVYIYRFIGKLTKGTTLTPSVSDLEFAEATIIRAVQGAHFAEEISNIKNNKKYSSILLRLKPFIDDGILRVGGRLSRADINYEHKHPAILPRREHVVDLIIDYYHNKYFHAGPELLMSLLRQRFWILAARRVIRYRIFKCNTCFRFNPTPTFPQMADLPSQRVNQVEKAFIHTGCDYAGPIQYTPIRSRGVKCRKAWLCVFTCLTTRAIHVEIATDLSTENFLQALKRFISRRGPVRCIYSDNGTNFVGARSYLQDLRKFVEETQPEIAAQLAKDRIDWKMIPPASPHFGGCWESMVKLVKTHLFKSIGQQILSYEELLTILTQIEALINSRPLTPLSSDPSEPRALTPAHFICSAPLSSHFVYETNRNLRERHSLLESIVQSFWKRWRAEYLHQLQTRSKWSSPSVPIREGTVVIVMTENVPLFSWPLGIIEKAHVSNDGIVRVAVVRTNRGTMVRPVIKLSPLPNQ